MIMNDKRVRTEKEMVMDYFKELSQHSPADTEKKHEKLQSDCQ
jgi:hypothetical protein